MLGDAGLADRSRIIMEKPFGTDLRSARELNAGLHQTFARGPDLPDRPLPRQGGGPQHPRLPLRQRAVRADLEPRAHRPRPDRRARDAADRAPDRLLREHRRLSGHGGHPPLPDPRLHVDGAADDPRLQGHQRGEEQGLPIDEADPAERRGAGPVRRLPRRARACRCTPTPRPSSPCGARSTTGAGPACPSTCAPASGWPRAPASSPSPFVSRRRACSRSGSGVGSAGPDHLTFDLADVSKLSLSFYGKRPGPGLTLDKQSLQFSLHETGRSADILEAYERLILDAMSGDHTLFSSAEGVERLWELSQPLLENPPPVRPYQPGLVGSQRHPPADRAVRLAAAVRAVVAPVLTAGPYTTGSPRPSLGRSTGAIGQEARRCRGSAPRSSWRARRPPASRCRPTWWNSWAVASARR